MIESLYEERDRNVLFNRKKKTQKFCKGKQGKKHVYEVQVDPRYDDFYYRRKFINGCYWESWTNTYSGRLLSWWHCRHMMSCIDCGQRRYIKRGQCPEYKDKPIAV